MITFCYHLPFLLHASLLPIVSYFLYNFILIFFTTPHAPFFCVVLTLLFCITLRPILQQVAKCIPLKPYRLSHFLAPPIISSRFPVKSHLSCPKYFSRTPQKTPIPFPPSNLSPLYYRPLFFSILFIFLVLLS